MANLYDRADIYDLFDSSEKYEVVKKHWQTVLNGKEVHSLLDVSIGTGQLTLPLSELGVEVHGSDLSSGMLEKCKEKAGQKGWSLDLRECDFRKLDGCFSRKFDCVASTGNSLPYVTNDEVLQVLEQMDRLVHKGGYLYFDIRNWDKILQEKKRFYLYNPVFVEDVRVNLIQVWDYHKDGAMTFHLLYTFEKDNKIFQKEQFEEHYYPVSRNLLLDKLGKLGYQNVQLFCHPAFLKGNPEDVDWYTVIAQKA